MGFLTTTVPDGGPSQTLYSAGGSGPGGGQAGGSTEVEVLRAGSPYFLVETISYWLYTVYKSYTFEDLFSVHDPTSWSSV